MAIEGTVSDRAWTYMSSTDCCCKPTFPAPSEQGRGSTNLPGALQWTGAGEAWWVTITTVGLVDVDGVEGGLLRAIGDLNSRRGAAELRVRSGKETPSDSHLGRRLTADGVNGRHTVHSPCLTSVQDVRTQLATDSVRAMTQTHDAWQRTATRIHRTEFMHGRRSRL